MGTIWPRPQTFHLPATTENLTQLAALAEKCQAMQVAVHLHVYSQGSVLLEWYDAFWKDPFYLSGAIAEDRVRAFSSALGVAYKEAKQNGESRRRLSQRRGSSSLDHASGTPSIVLLFLALLFLNTGCSHRPFRAGSSSMFPTIQSNELVFADMTAYHKGKPSRWDVVVFHPPAVTKVPKQFWIMRVIGLPGEELAIRPDGIYVNGERETQPERITGIRYLPTPPSARHLTVSFPYKIPAGCYFLAGDNTEDAFDSRFWGALPERNILGRVKNK